MLKFVVTSHHAEGVTKHYSEGFHVDSNAQVIGGSVMLKL
jgi:hypothetical protein